MHFSAAERAVGTVFNVQHTRMRYKLPIAYQADVSLFSTGHLPITIEGFRQALGTLNIGYHLQILSQSIF
jgi:hypothetical protein